MMRLGKSFGTICVLVGVMFGLAACGGSGSGSGFGVSQALQNMTLDPTGLTVDITFSREVDPISSAIAGNYTCSGGQAAQSATLLADGRTVRIVLDTVVIPGEGTLQVSGVGDLLGKIMNAQLGIAITSTDSTAPTVSATVAEAVSNAANDEVRITFDEGMAPGDMADLSLFTLESPTGTWVDWSGSTMSWDAGTNELTIVLDNTGGDADDLQVGATFSVAIAGVRDLAGNTIEATTESGSVGGDQTKPTVLSITQNLAVDPLGKTVDVLFDEDIDEVSGEVWGNYIPSEGQIVQTVAVSGSTARVQLNQPAVPGSTTFAVDGVSDRAGNMMIAASGVPVGGTDSTPPTMDTVVATAISGRYNDTIVVTFSEAMVPADVIDITRYGLYSPGTSQLDLNGAVATYDESTRSVTITMIQVGVDQINLQTGDSWTFEVSNVRDVAGNPLAFAQESGNVVGDATAPTLIAAFQDTNIEPGGTLVGFQFDEDIADATAVVKANFAASGGQTPLISNVYPFNGSLVYVFFDAPVVPGVHTVDALGQADVAGNLGADYTAQSVVPFDTTAPQLAAVTGAAVPGAGNDRITVTFTEPMYEPDVTNLANYAFQNPTGSTLSVTTATISWNAATRTSTIVLDETGVAQDNLVPGEQLVATLSNVRDIAGNTIASPAQVTAQVSGDGAWPQTVIAWQNTAVDGSGATVDIVFSEALEQSSAETAANWSLSSAGGWTVVSASLVGSEDIVRVVFSGAVTPGADTLSFQNIRDKAQNQIPPVAGLAIATSETTSPTVAGVDATTSSGGGNDVIEITWSEDIHPGDGVDPARFSVTDGGVAIDASVLEEAVFSYDQATTTTTILFGHACGYNLTTGNAVVVTPNGVRDIRGNVQGGTSGSDPTTPGDSTQPVASAAQIYQHIAGTISVSFDEEIDPDTVDMGDFTHATLNVTGVSVLEGRTVLVTFDGDLVPGVDTIDVQNISDLAGNALGLTTMAIATADTTAPTATVVAQTVSGRGNDWIRVTFSEPILPSSATNPSLYSFQSPAGTAIALSGADFVYDSNSMAVTITLPEGTWMRTGATFSMEFLGIEDTHLNALSGVRTGTVGGDSQPPLLVGADRNLVVDPTGTTVDVSFDEPMDPISVETVSNWSCSGTQSVSSATLLYGGRTVRLVFSAAVTPGTDTLAFSGLMDLAANAMASHSLVPIAD